MGDEIDKVMGKWIEKRIEKHIESQNERIIVLKSRNGEITYLAEDPYPLKTRGDLLYKSFRFEVRHIMDGMNGNRKVMKHYLMLNSGYRVKQGNDLVQMIEIFRHREYSDERIR